MINTRFLNPLNLADQKVRREGYSTLILLSFKPLVTFGLATALLTHLRERQPRLT